MRLLRIPEVLAKTGFSRSRLYEAVSRGDFPQPVKLGGVNARAVAFSSEEVDLWIEELLAARESEAA